MMENLPLHESGAAPRELPGQANTGLWWNKFFHFYEYGFTDITQADTRNKIPDGKVRWIETVEGQHGQTQIIDSFIQRQLALGIAQNAQQKLFKTNWLLATGLGYSHPVENGFCWHHTLGIPYLPASGVKGLLRAWIEQWEFDDWENNPDIKALREKVLLSWFGNETDEPDHEKHQAGNLIFFDAIPINSPTLVADVMTPHMGKWYAEGNKIKNPDGSGTDGSRIPGDWNTPVPVPFLAVKDTCFLFQMAARPKSTFEAGYDLNKAMELLQLALENLGAGAKTAAGYGRMTEDVAASEIWEKKQEASIKKHTREVQREAKRRAAAAKMETEEIVIMIAEPDIANSSVKVKTESGEEFVCTNVPPFENFTSPLARWQSTSENDHKIEAKVTRENGVIAKVLFAEWH